MTAPEAVRALLADRGYDFVEPPILHDADVFLDLAGEDLRRRLFLTPSGDDMELCLRPDYTIPVCLHHLTTGDPRRRGDYAYLGPVFRQRPGETGEFTQAGVESIGRSDATAADAEILALAMEAVEASGLPDMTVRIGDAALFEAVVEGLAIPEAWRRRLARAFGDRDKLERLIGHLAGGEGSRPAYAGFLAALDGSDHAAARRVIDDLLAIAGIKAVGGRSVAEIADRFLEQAALQAGVGEGIDEVLRAFLAINGETAAAAAEMEELARAEGLNIGPALDRFWRRHQGMEERRIGLGRITFAADFGRRLDYYTGFVFEIHDPKRPDAGPLVGGGRYDRLLSLIVKRDGSGEDIPAVGFALWLDRVVGGLS